jgi:hypothetical protein
LGVNRFCEVDGELVIPARVCSQEICARIDACLLSCALKVQQGAPAGIGVVRFQPTAIPTLALVVGHVGIDGVLCVIAVRQAHRLPVEHCPRVVAPDLPDAAQLAADVLPVVDQAFLVFAHLPSPSVPAIASAAALSDPS